ncbi:MAG: threonine synthase [Spirochaetales bacterium]|nr:threonine synthase [Spirochaetales bacterium]
MSAREREPGAPRASGAAGAPETAGAPGFAGYRCSVCGSEHGPEEPLYLCPRDQGCLEVVLDYSRIRRRIRQQDLLWGEPSQWRFLPLLPVGDPGGEGTPLRRVGHTPVYRLPALERALGSEQVWLKDEGANPTASLKDRASALVVARARELGATTVVTASTGNAGAALAGMAAAVEQPAVVFAPKGAPPAKIAQMLVFGARVILVDGSYDQAVELSRQAAQELGWYCRNTGYNPFTAEGKKTAAFEVWSSLVKGKIRTHHSRPLSVFVSVGDGNIIAGLHKGFRDLEALGWLAAMPRLYGVQAEGSAAVARAFRSGSSSIEAVQARTLADSISVDRPADGLRALRAATETGGAYLTVSDRQILEAIATLGAAGIFAEPAAAAAFAGALQARQDGTLHSADPVLILITGSGLKDVAAAQACVTAAPVIEPSLSALKRLIGA